MAIWTAAPSADTSFGQASATTGRGTEVTATVGIGNFSLHTNAAFRFDITTMPTTDITDATVSFDTTGVVSMAGRILSVYGLTEGSGAEFSEGQGLGQEANWNNWGGGNAWAVPGGATDGILGHMDFAGDNLAVGTTTLDILDLVNAAISQSYTTLGLLFYVPGLVPTCSVTFQTREGTVEPVLTITTDDDPGGGGDEDPGGDGTDRPECFTRIDMARRPRKRKLVWVRFNRL